MTITVPTVFVPSVLVGYRRLQREIVAAHVRLKPSRRTIAPYRTALISCSGCASYLVSVSAVTNRWSVAVALQPVM